ncbi:hypothetical protein [uncultured Bacteroides sp.]|uniref:hypothetical protein n=1 Tax=uncultured Bacteroides sp. TaxID=162156 RepID=UPI002AAAA334|nr:hypothetical protein [uncultured Bacteroides sp.]
MKKLLLLAMLFTISLTCYSQEKQSEKLPKTKSKSIEFMSKDGTFIEKQFYDLGKIKGLHCEVLIIIDVVNQKKVGCLRLETSYSSSYSSDTYIGTLDYDEIDACIKSLNYILNDILLSHPDTYTETEYKSRDGVKFGTFYTQKKDKWTAFVYTKGYTNKSAEFFDSSNINALVQVMENAKKMILEKTK